MPCGHTTANSYHMPQRVNTFPTLIDLLTTATHTNTDTDVVIPPDFAQAIIDKLALLASIERKLRATPAGALLIDAEIAGLR